MDKELLIENIEKIHTTKLGLIRISKNIDVNIVDVVNYCINLIKLADSTIYRKGKNYYVENKNITITINVYSYTIITAHKK